MKNKISALIIMIFSQFAGYGQQGTSPGYILNSNMDTIYGIGKIGHNHEFIWFKQNNMQRLHKYYPDQIYCVWFNSGKYYVPKEISCKKVYYKLFQKKSVTETTRKFFFEYLIDGEVDIFKVDYEGHRKYYIEKSKMPLQELPFYEYLMKVDHKYYQIKNTVFREFITTYMEDSPKTCNKIDNIPELTPVVLIKLAEEYHYDVCDTYDCINYTKKIFGHKPKIK